MALNLSSSCWWKIIELNWRILHLPYGMQLEIFHELAERKENLYACNDKAAKQRHKAELLKN